MQATGGRSVLILGTQGRGGDGMEIDEQAKAQAVVSPWPAPTLVFATPILALLYFA